MNSSNAPVVRSAARALDLLELIAESDGGISLTAAASSLKLPKSSALMLLRTLVARGYVVRTEEDRYVLNEDFRRHGFGWGGNRFARVVALAKPVMQRLSDKLGETLLLGVPEDDGQVRLLSKVIARQDIRYDVDLAIKLPAYCTALGRVFLAGLDPERRRAVLSATKRTKRTSRTVTELERLEVLIDQAAAHGYAVVEEEYAVGGTGIAAPIVDVEGRTIAALNVGCVTARFPLKRLAIIAALLREAGGLSSVISRPRAARTTKRTPRRPSVVGE
jgi:DNA-binding IclR family transcriptional regulator